MGSVIKFNCLTGLRPSEAIDSVRLLNVGTLLFSNSRNGSYYNAERQCLEHFRHPETFLRRTKCAYVSFVTKEQLSAIGVLDCKTPTPLIQPFAWHANTGLYRWICVIVGNYLQVGYTAVIFLLK